MEILDTAGQEDFSQLIAHWIRNYHVFLLVYSITNRPSFIAVSNIHKFISRHLEGQNVPYVLVGNKCDQEQIREVSTAEASVVAQQLDAEFLECSAKTRHNVDEVFHTAIRLFWRLNPVVAKKPKKRCIML